MSSREDTILDLLAQHAVVIAEVSSSFARSSGGLIAYDDAEAVLRLMIVERHEALSDPRIESPGAFFRRAATNRLKDLLDAERRAVMPDGQFYDSRQIIELLTQGLDPTMATDYGSAAMDGTHSPSPASQRGTRAAGVADVMAAYQAQRDDHRRVLFVAATVGGTMADQALVLGMTEVAYRRARSRCIGRIRAFLNRMPEHCIGQRRVMSNIEAMALTSRQVA